MTQTEHFTSNTVIRRAMGLSFLVLGCSLVLVGLSAVPMFADRIVSSPGTWSEMGSEFIDLANNTNQPIFTQMSAAGDLMVAGYPYDDTGGDFAGAVRLYKRESFAWIQIGADLIGEPEEKLGEFVRISGDGGTLIAVTNKKSADSQSTLQVYDINDDGFNHRLTAVLLPGSVRIPSINHTGERLAVTEFDSFSMRPVVTVLDISGSEAIQVGRKIYPDGAEYNRYVTMDSAGDTIVVSGGVTRSAGVNAGRAYIEVYDFDGTEWSDAALVPIPQSGLGAYGQYGSDHAISDISGDGNVIVMAVPNFNYQGLPGTYGSGDNYEDPANYSGLLVRFERQDQQWTQVGTELIGVAGSRLGISLYGGALDFTGDNLIAIAAASAPEEVDGAISSYSGYAQLLPLSWENEGWTQRGNAITATAPEISAFPFAPFTYHLTINAAQISADGQSFTRSTGLADYLPDQSGFLQPAQIYGFTTLTDQLVLEEVYDQLGGVGWLDDTGWLRADHCSWSGILCDSNGFVNAVWLQGNGLEGQLPREIGRLTYLQSLDVSHNDLRGGLIDELSDIPNLSSLYAKSSGLSGPIPASFGSQQRLQHLDLSANNFAGGLDVLFSLKSLKQLNAANNNFEGTFNGAITAMPELERLDLSYNRLSGDLTTLSTNLPSLRRIIMDGNLLQGLLPETLRDLTGLTELSVSDNELTGIISETMGNFIAGMSYSLTGNHFICPYPSALVEYFTDEQDSCTPPSPPSGVQIVSVKTDDGALIIAVTYSDDGWAPITRYEVTCSDGINSFTGSSSSSPVRVEGLTNDTAYSCSATARNSAGVSEASQLSSPVAPEEILTGLPIWLLYEASKGS